MPVEREPFAAGEVANRFVAFRDLPLMIENHDMQVRRALRQLCGAGFLAARLGMAIFQLRGYH